MVKLASYKVSRLLSVIITILMIVGCASRPPKIDVPLRQPTPKPLPQIDIALVLGGGGAKGLAHVGVLEAFEEHGIPVNLIVGSSAGSIIGVLYGDEPCAKRLKSKILHLKQGDLLDPHYSLAIQGLVNLTGLIQGHKLQEFLLENMQARDLRQLKIPNVVVATDIVSNRIELLRAGPIAPAVNASSALPPYFTPVTLYGQTLIDGGVIQPVPVGVAKMFKPKLIIAVDISTPPPNEEVNNVFDLTYRALHISYYELSRRQSNLADIVIHPNLIGIGTFDDESNQHIFDAGKSAALVVINDIKQKMKSLNIKTIETKKYSHAT